MEKRFQDMQVCKDFKHKNKDKILLYIELMYNQQSKLNSIENLGDRKIAACNSVGLDLEDQFVKDLIDMKNEDTKELIFSYQVANNTNKYFKLLSDQQLFWDIQKLVSSPVDSTDDKKMKLRIEMSESSGPLLDRIEIGFRDIFGITESVEDAKKFVLKQQMRPEERLLKKVAS